MLTVYIADDEVWVVLGLQKQLKKTGLAVKVVGSANNGLTARDEIGKLKPDIVFTDIRMPGENGLELLKDIGELSPDTRVVIISGYADFAYAQEAIRGNAYEYIVKPIHEEDLKNVLERIIKEINPEIKGVIIVAEGAKDSKVKLKISRAVQTVLDIPAYRVTVYERN